eukprot:2847451-Pyramimonas_sp.AAC.1
MEQEPPCTIIGTAFCFETGDSLAEGRIRTFAGSRVSKDSVHGRGVQVTAPRLETVVYKITYTTRRSNRTVTSNVEFRRRSCRCVVCRSTLV